MKKRIAYITITLLSLLFMAEKSSNAQTIGLATNAVDYLYFGTANAEAQIALAQHWSIAAGFRYNPFTFREDTSKQFQQRQRCFYLGSRYWTWNTYSGLWFSLRGQWQEYNEGGLATLETSEGDRFGAGFSVGYTIMLNEHFNIDLGLGIWGGYDKYTVYACPNCGRIVEQGGKSFVAPNEALLSLLYVF